MQSTYERTLNKFIAIILVIVLTLADLITLGLNFTSLAIDMVATNSNNVEFEAYFKGPNGEKIKEKEEAINAEKISMYIEVSVVREGYFNGKITMQDSNLQIIGITDNPFVNSFESNSITFNQINSSKKVTVEVQLKAKTDTLMNINMLDKNNTLKIEGTYTSSNGTVEIEGTTNIKMKFVTPNDATSLLDTSIISNKIYNLDGVNKRIIQILVRSKIKDNIYPVKTSIIDIKIPEEVEDLEVIARSTDATKKDAQFSQTNYTFNKENSNVQIRLENKKDEKENISFEKNAKDEFIITCVYPENKEFKEELKIAQKITTYDEKELKSETTTVIEKEKDGIINYESYMQENEIYKGKIYSGENRTYNINIRSYINSLKVKKNIEFTLEKTNYLIGETKKASNISYKEIILKKQECEKVLGEKGFITLKDENGTVLANITKESMADENNNIKITIPQNTYKIYIESSQVETIGKIDFLITKEITEKEYTKDEIKLFSGIENKVITNTEEKIDKITLKETVTEAKFDINTSSLKAGENENIQMKVTLLSNDESKDLYKNPTIKIAFPEDTTELSAKYKMLYGNGLEKNTAVVKEEEGKKVLEINLQGEQEEYPGKVIDGTNILVNANIKMNKLSTGKDESISLTYTNENANGYSNEGIITRSLSIEPSTDTIAVLDQDEGTNPQYLDANLMISYISDEEKLQSNTIYDLHLFVKNNTSSDIENAEVRFFTNDLFKVDRIISENVDSNGVLHISKIEANETESIFLKVRALKPTTANNEAEIISKVTYQNNEYTSNRIRKKIEDIDANMTITTTPQVTRDDDTVKYGEKVVYTINVASVGLDDMNQTKLDFVLSDFADVEKVEVGNEEYEYNLIQYENSITRKIKIDIKEALRANTNIDIKITIKVKKADANSKQMNFVHTAHLLNNDIEITYQQTKALGIYELIYNQEDTTGAEITEEDLASREQDNNTDGVISEEDLKENEPEEDLPKTITEEDLKDYKATEEDEENGGEGTSAGDNNQNESADGQNQQGQTPSTDKEGQSKKYSISGQVWLDESESADRKQSNKGLQGIKIKLVNESTGNIQNNEEGTAITAETNEKGEYTLNSIPEGKYIVVFEYDTTKYKLTEYQKEGITSEYNSDAIVKELEIGGTKTVIAATDILEVKENKQNIDLGLIETKKFDLELTKTINKVTVTNRKGTKEYKFKDSVLAKVEIDPKELDNSKIKIEYSIKIKNTGEITGYAKKIIDYIPAELEFNQDLNEGWVKDGEYISSTNLSNDEIKAGETKELTLILTKTMTASDTGLISNVAEIEAESNNLEIQDTDSTPGNRKNGEDDLGQADLIIGVKTGIITRVIYFVTAIILLSCTIYLVKLKKKKS